MWKIIKVWEAEFELDCGDRLTVKEYRKIEPALIKADFKYTSELFISVIKILVISMTPEEAEEKINTFDMEELNILTGIMVELLDSKKKTKE